MSHACAKMYGMEDERAQTTLEILRKGPVDEWELAEMVGVDLEEDPYFFTELGGTWTNPQGLVVLESDALDGLVLTHQITSDDITTGLDDDHVDLEVLFWLDQSIELPPSVKEGDLIAVRYSDGDTKVTIIDVSDLSDGSAEAKALRDAFDERNSRRDFDEVAPFILDIRTTNREPFAKPVPPICELVESTGFKVWQGRLIGYADVPWDRRDNRFGQDRFNEISDEFDFDHCCETAFSRVLNEWSKLRPSADTVRRDLKHASVTAALAKWSSAAIEGSKWLRSFAESLSDRDEMLAIKSFLLAAVAEAESDDDTATALYESALDYENEDVRFSAATFLSKAPAVRGDAKATLDVWRRASVPSYEREMLEAFLHPTVGRNDPCICGSGKKFKQCCINRGNLNDVERLDWLYKRLTDFVESGAEATMAKLRIFAFAAQSDIEISGIPDEIADDLALFDFGIATRYLDEFESVMHAADVRLLRSAIETPRALWKVNGDLLITNDAGLSGRVRLTGNRIFDFEPGEVVIGRFMEVDDFLVNVGVIIATTVDYLDSREITPLDLLQMGDFDDDFDEQPVSTAFAWFPAGEWEEARKRWPELRDIDLPVEHRQYSRHIQGRIRALEKMGYRELHVSPITGDGLIDYAESHDMDPGAGDTRAAYAAELLRLGRAIAWPPGEDESCWCGSGLTYKACCMTAPIKEG